MRIESLSTTVNRRRGATPLRAWVTGAGGLIGSALLRSASPTWEVYGTTRQQVDLTNAATLKVWPLQLIVVDMLWGAVLTGLSTLAGWLVFHTRT